MAVNVRTPAAIGIEIPDTASEPVWEIAQLFPNQGAWSEADYLGLETNRLIEYAHGHVEVLAMPGERHQRIVLLLLQLLAAHVQQRRLGVVLMAPFPIRLWTGKFREPDIVFMRAEHNYRRHEQFWDGADLVVEVVSPDDPNRDLVVKREEYARAGIPEYWIVEQRPRTVTVLILENDAYTVRGVFTVGERASSQVLDGFAIEVATLFNDDLA